MEQIPGHYDYRDPPVPLDDLRRADERSRMACDGGAGESAAGDWMTGSTEQRPGFWAVITDVAGEAYFDGRRYSFIEAGVTPDGLYTAERLEMGRFGTNNAREWNDNAHVPDGAVVWMTHETALDLDSPASGAAAYRFAYRPLSTISEEEEITGDVTVEQSSTWFINSVVWFFTNTLVTLTNSVWNFIDGGVSLTNSFFTSTGSTFNIKDTTVNVETSSFYIENTVTTELRGGLIRVPAGQEVRVEGPGALRMGAIIRQPPFPFAVVAGPQVFNLTSVPTSHVGLTGATGAFSVTSITGMADGEFRFFVNQSPDYSFTIPAGAPFAGVTSAITVPPGGSIGITRYGSQYMITQTGTTATTAGGSGLVVGTTGITSGAADRLLYDDGTTLRECTLSGLTLAAGVLSVTGAASGTPSWATYTKTYADFASSNPQSIVTLPARTYLHAVFIRTTTAFGGGTIVTYSVTLRRGSDPLCSTDGMVANYTGQRASSGADGADFMGVEPTYASTTLFALAAAGGGALGDATSGVVDILVQTSTMP